MKVGKKNVTQTEKAIAAALAAALLASASLARAATHEVDVAVETASGHPDELAVAKTVKRLIRQHGLAPWMFTIPHSHPVLTLNTRYLGDDTEILSNLVHEQLHWFVLEHQKALGASLREIRALYPDAPGEPPQGASSLRSTYLHLVVCTLEYEALEARIGRRAAEEKLLSKPYYRWVFRTVVEDRATLRAVLEDHGLVLP